jgi:hypothetical protein
LQYVERLPRVAEMAAGTRHAAGVGRPLQHLEPPVSQADLLCLGHRVSAPRLP